MLAPNPKPQELVRVHLTQAQREQVRIATGRDGSAIELTVEELEERIAPRLATNYNETLLADR
jgi:hypothetical protein